MGEQGMNLVGTSARISPTGTKDGPDMLHVQY